MEIPLFVNDFFKLDHKIKPLDRGYCICDSSDIVIAPISEYLRKYQLLSTSVQYSVADDAVNRDV